MFNTLQLTTMKKYMALGILSLCSITTFAQSSIEPVIIPDATARKISTDGNWVACYGMTILVYNVDTKDIYAYPECSIGNGNAVALDGTTAGVVEDYAVLMKNGDIKMPEIFSEYDFSGINGITSDGKRVTGYVKNPVLNGDNPVDPFDEGITVFVPFYSDVTSDGSIEKINLLPCPEKDFLGYAPMYVTGVWISDDGKTILGKMTDSFGRMEDPVIYHENEKGEWSYITPTKAFFNPTGVVLPENPWNNAPNEPKYRDYMTPLQYAAYQKAVEESLFGGPEADPFTFMDDDMIKKYLEDYEEYENYFYTHIAEIDAYEKAYRELLETSLFFGDSVLDPNGEIFVTSGSTYDDEPDSKSMVVIGNAQTGEYKQFYSKYSGLNIYQVLSDGTVLAYTGLFTYDVLMGYILLPGAEDFIPFSEYLANTNPEYAKWLNDTFPNGEGIISASDDLSVVAGGVDILHMNLSDEVLDTYDGSIMFSYILPAVKEAGVETIELPNNDGIYRVYNLMGVKVLETTDKSELTKIGKGIYIINGKKVIM